MSIDILIVDDEEGIRNLVKGILQDEGFVVRTAANAEAAYKQIDTKVPDLMILDIWLQESHHDGLQILETVKRGHRLLPVLMISGHGTIETAVTAIKKGAYDFIEKPFKSDRLLMMINRAIENASLKKENEILRQKAEKIGDEMVGSTPIIQGLQQMLEKVAPTNSRVLITGEAGTGKNLVARYIHQASKRAENPFVAVNCSTLQSDRLEVEIFGSVDGVMNEPAKIGALEMAEGGTLLLDEVGDMPLDVQGKVLRFLQEESYKRVGDSKTIKSNIRILSTSSLDIEKASKDGKFRQDLFYRLNVVSLQMPPLRKRSHDIPALIESLSSSLSRESGLVVKTFTPEAIEMMEKYDWPGNIRQLRNTLEWVSIMAGKSSVTEFGIDHLPPEITGSLVQDEILTSASVASGGDQNIMKLTLREAREVFERDYLLAQIKRFSGNVSKTAQFVGMERSALHRKLKSLDVIGMDRPQDGEYEEEGPAVKKASQS